MSEKKYIEYEKQDTYRMARNLIDNLSILCAAHPDKIIDLLTPYLWDEEEAVNIKRTTNEVSE